MFITGKASNVLAEKITSKKGEEYKKTSFTVSNEHESIRLETLSECNVGEGDTGQFVFSSKVREWQGKWFNSLTFTGLNTIVEHDNKQTDNSQTDDSDLPF